MRKAPDRERWTGWVAIAWILALLAIAGGIFAIATAGFVEVPRQNSYGRLQTVTEPNIFIWAIAIGQAVSATMLAAIFSMINSIYQNTCDQLGGVEFSSSREQKKVPASAQALRLTTVPASSILSNALSTGDMVTGVNGYRVSSLDELTFRVLAGENIISFLTMAGEEKEAALQLSPSSLAGVKGEACSIPGYQAVNQGRGLRVLSVHRASPLSGLLHEGCVLLSINDKPALTEKDAAESVVKGKNIIKYIDAEGNHKAYAISFNPGPLHINFAS